MKKALPSAARLRVLLDRFAEKRIFVLGDLMLDHFIRGRVSRISPEAPVPVVAVFEESHMPGGAGNVCSNLSALDAKVSVFSTVGDDLAGNQLLRDFERSGVDTRGVVLDASRVTTQKSRVVADHQQVVRFDRETPQSVSSASQLELLGRLEADLSNADALVISDYGKGIVSKAVVQRALKIANKIKLPVLVDPKVEHFRRYKGVDCITPNLQEAWGGMRQLPPADDAALVRLGWKIVKELRLRSALITRGEKGMNLFERGQPVRHIPTQAREVYDVTGAGDTVISVMALALAAKAKLVEAATLANLAAGIVVGKLGTATTSVREIRAELASRRLR